MPADDGIPRRDIDIAKPRSWRRSQRKKGLPWWLTVLLVLAILGAGQLWPTAARSAWLILLGVVVLPVIALIVWIVVRDGLLTWMRLARKPARALARSDTAGAERAFGAGLSRARRFSANDYRRGVMVVELAAYLKRLGRFPEAKALLEEGVEILGQQWKSRPQQYFIALNNLAVYLIDVQDHAAAQGILEKLLDLTLYWSKGGIEPNVAVPTAALIELVLHLNLVTLFVRMEELDLAADHMEEADTLFGKLGKRQRQLRDHHLAVRALLLYAEGRFKRAAAELNKVEDLENPMGQCVRIKLTLARGEFARAEQLQRKYLDQVGKHGSLHRPDLREHMQELAESLFGQNKHDEAFRALEEAFAISTEYALPTGSAWRKALVDWRHRAHELGRTTDVAWLEAESRRISTAPEQTITILPRLRIRPR